MVVYLFHIKSFWFIIIIIQSSDIWQVCPHCKILGSARIDRPADSGHPSIHQSIPTRQLRTLHIVMWQQAFPPFCPKCRAWIIVPLWTTTRTKLSFLFPSEEALVHSWLIECRLRFRTRPKMSFYYSQFVYGEGHRGRYGLIIQQVDTGRFIVECIIGIRQ